MILFGRVLVVPEMHLDQFDVLPALTLLAGECSNPECGTKHFLVSAAWLVFSVDFYF